MRLLMFYTQGWWHRSAGKGLPEVPDLDDEQALQDGVVAVFFHAEPRDEEDRPAVIRKFVKNVKWIAGKFGCRQVVLHSFNHLGQDKAPPEVALGIMDEVQERLSHTDYHVIRTPFGYFNEFRMHVAGDSLAKVYKEF